MVNQNYRIPNRIKNLMTIEFLQIFKDKLDEIFEIKSVETAWSYYYHVESTCGFHKALEYACDNHKYSSMGVGIKRYINSLNWYNGDLFDNELVELMIKSNIIERGEVDDYISTSWESEVFEGIDYQYVQTGEGSGCKFYTKEYILD